MQESVQLWLTKVSKIGIVVVIFATLFLFTNLTTDFYDAPKFLCLLVVTGALLILTTLKFALSSKVVWVRTSLDLPLVLLAVVAAISTFLSPSPYVSLLGQGVFVHNSLVSLITYILFYFVVVNNLRSVKDIHQVTFLLTVGGVFLSVISLLSFAGIKLLPAPWNHGVNFTTTGSNFSTTALLALLVPITALEILGKSKLAIRVAYALVLALFGIVIAITGSLASITGALLGISLVLILYRSQVSSLLNISSLKSNLGIVALISSLVVVILVTLLAYMPFPGNILNKLSKSFPRETQLSFPLSWKISVSAFRDSPFWGTGLSTYLHDFTAYKPIEFNKTSSWNIRFDNAFNEYLSMLATLGGVGLAALIFATVFFLSTAYRAILAVRNTVSDLTPSLKLSLGLSISGIVFFVILFLHASTLAFMVVGFLLLASFMSVNHLLNAGSNQAWKKESGLKQTLMRVASSMNLTGAYQETLNLDALPTVMLTVSVALVGFAFFFGGKYALADFHHRQALNAITQNQGLQAYNELVAAEKLNPNNDLYRTDLAQTNFALANAIAISKGPTQAAPNGTLNDQDRQNIQVLLNQAITEGKTATILNPRSSANWEILGSLYRQISGVAQNALLFALDSYGRSIQNDPLNPILRLNVGGVYYAIQSYDMAIRFFTDTINLKPDYANGFYNLSVAYRDKGDLQSAIAAAQQAVTLLDKNSPDYKTASDYLTDLQSKNETATKSANMTASTVEDKGALQQKELPKVVELPKPENIATPAAIKASPSPEPTANP